MGKLKIPSNDPFFFFTTEPTTECKLLNLVLVFLSYPGYVFAARSENEIVKLKKYIKMVVVKAYKNVKRLIR